MQIIVEKGVDMVFFFRDPHDVLRHRRGLLPSAVSEFSLDFHYLLGANRSPLAERWEVSLRTKTGTHMRSRSEPITDCDVNDLIIDARPGGVRPTSSQNGRPRRSSFKVELVSRFWWTWQHNNPLIIHLAQTTEFPNITRSQLSLPCNSE